MRLAVLADVFKAKAHRHIKVELNSTELPLTAERIVYLQIDLRPIECATTFVYLVRDVVGLNRLPQRLGRLIPILRLSHVLLRARGKVGREIAQVESPQNEKRELESAADFFLYLIGAAKDVRVILGETPNAGKTV